MSTLPEMEAKMEECDTTLHPDSDPKEKMDQLKAITNDVIAEGKKVDDLKKVNTVLGINKWCFEYDD